MEAIKTTDLRKEYKDTVAVKSLDLEVHEGELFSLLGVNGAGKTTTVKMLTGLSKPTAGDALICGFSVVRELDRIKPLVDVSMQETAVARNLTVEENIDFCAALAGKSKSEVAEVKKNLYDIFGFESIKNKRAAKLSGGWQRKLSIALALVSSPKVLFLDEPTLGLDVIARRELWKLIRGLHGEMTIVLTTHYMEEAEALSDRLGVMKDGELLFVGTIEQMYKKTGCSNVEDAFVKIVEGGDSLE